ncbi:hypothetical protein Bca4012_070131 [Brassica carinata]
MFGPRHKKALWPKRNLCIIRAAAYPRQKNGFIIKLSKIRKTQTVKICVELYASTQTSSYHLFKHLCTQIAWNAKLSSMKLREYDDDAKQKKKMQSKTQDC